MIRCRDRGRPISGGRSIAVALVLALTWWGCRSGSASHNVSETRDQGSEAEERFDVEQRLQDLGIRLSTPAPPVANYVRAVRSGNLVFLAGHIPTQQDGTYVIGKVGSDLTVDEGYEAARLASIAMLASLKQEIGDLNRVERIVKVFGMVNSDPGFTGQSSVVNGCSDLLVSVFGERGKHARAAVGMASLPLGVAVEIEMIVQIADD